MIPISIHLQSLQVFQYIIMPQDSQDALKVWHWQKVADASMSQCSISRSTLQFSVRMLPRYWNDGTTLSMSQLMVKSGRVIGVFSSSRLEKQISQKLSVKGLGEVDKGYKQIFDVLSTFVATYIYTAQTHSISWLLNKVFFFNTLCVAVYHFMTGLALLNGKTRVRMNESRME